MVGSQCCILSLESSSSIFVKIGTRCFKSHYFLCCCRCSFAKEPNWRTINCLWSIFYIPTVSPGYRWATGMNYFIPASWFSLVSLPNAQLLFMCSECATPRACSSTKTIMHVIACTIRSLGSEVCPMCTVLWAKSTMPTSKILRECMRRWKWENHHGVDLLFCAGKWLPALSCEIKRDMLPPNLICVTSNKLQNTVTVDIPINKVWRL